jgi:hypothetical protein
LRFHVPFLSVEGDIAHAMHCSAGSLPGFICLVK